MSAVGQLVIRNAQVLSAASPDGAAPGDIWIRGDRIVAIESPGAPPPPGWQRAGPRQEIDAAGCLAIPGLVDAHSHSYTSLLRGTVAGAPLDLFVIDAMARRAPRAPRAVYVGTALHALELLKRGVTALVDHFRHGALPSVEAVEQAFAAYRDIGVRATIAPMYEDRNYLDSLPIDAARLPPPILARWRAMTRPAPDAYFDLMDALLSWRGREGRLDLMLGVDGPQRCTPRLLALAGAYAKRHALGLHTHLLEARTQALMAPEPGGFVDLLDRHGLVDSRTSLVHFVWCGERDIALAAERGANVVHNPVSNMHLGSGFLPVHRLIEQGVNVALGTDSESGTAAGMLEAAKWMALASRVQALPAAQWVDARTAFAAATAGGARAIGKGEDLGVLAAGRLADLALIEVTGLDWQPRGDLHAHLVMYENGSNVRDVIVGGRVVVRDARATCVNEEDLIAEAVECAHADARANAPWLAIAEQERGAFATLIEEALAAPLARERHARLR